MEFAAKTQADPKLFALTLGGSGLLAPFPAGDQQPPLTWATVEVVHLTWHQATILCTGEPSRRYSPNVNGGAHHVTQAHPEADAERGRPGSAAAGRGLGCRESAVKRRMVIETAALREGEPRRWAQTREEAECMRASTDYVNQLHQLPRALTCYPHAPFAVVERDDGDLGDRE